MTLRSTILVAEDDSLLRMVLSDHLHDSGFDVIEATNVLHAVGLLGRNSIDALITDVDMPGSLSGLDLASLVAACRPNIPIVIASGRAIGLSEIPSGAFFVPKPYDLVHLTTLVGAGIANGFSCYYRSVRASTD